LREGWIMTDEPFVEERRLRFTVYVLALPP
jgi:hypothetical protein